MASSLSLLLLHCSPGRGHHIDADLELQPRNGPPVPCHGAVLKARCPALPLERPCTVVDEDHEVVCALLHWIYGERVQLNDYEAGLSDRVLRLAEQLGLRDAASLRERLHGNWRRRHRSCLGQDLARAFADRSLDGLWFLCGEPGADGDANRLVYGGFPPLLRVASSYFDAMLSGKWAETAEQPVKVGWPAHDFERLMEFLHGGPEFIRDAQDLEKAVRCADFFGLPALLLHANQWIADHLQPKNAPRLWNFVESEPRLRLNQIQDGVIQEDLFVDADDACFDFHIREFASMALSETDEGTEEEDCWVPLHDLSPTLMQRLLRSGSLDVSTDYLKAIVLRYCHAKWEKTQAKVQAKQMLPPAVLFNRHIRDQLMGGTAISIRAVL